MPVVMFKGEFSKRAVEPAPDFQQPEWPKMEGNNLTEGKDGWHFEMLWRFPGGRPRFASILVPGNEGAVRLTLSTADFWKNMWETMIIDMQGSGEGLGVRLPGTRH